MGAPNTELLKAVDLALTGDWNAAHQIVQLHEDHEIAAWIHAVLHKVEGDTSNARYWYHQANQLNHQADEPNAELNTIKIKLSSES